MSLDEKLKESIEAIDILVLRIQLVLSESQDRDFEIETMG
jgi:hypothetical protein